MAKKPVKKKFFGVDMPLINENTEILSFTREDLEGKSIKIDMTRKLKGKSSDLVLTIKVSEDKIIAIPKKFRVLPYFIKHMLRKRISYVEDSIKGKTKESHIIVKPFLITRKRVSRVVRKTLRNSARNWIIDYLKTKKDEEVFKEVLSGEMQKALSIKLKKIYPLSLSEIRVLEIKNALDDKEAEEVKELEVQEKKDEKEKKQEKVEAENKEVKKEKKVEKKAEKKKDKEE